MQQKTSADDIFQIHFFIAGERLIKQVVKIISYFSAKIYTRTCIEGTRKIRLEYIVLSSTFNKDY